MAHMDNELYQISTSVTFPCLEDDERNDHQRKLSGSGSISIPSVVYSRRSSRNSPLESPGYSYGRRGSQASLNFHEISINTLHINSMSPRRRKDSIPDDQYSGIGTFSFGTAETTPSRSTTGETDADSLYHDDPERPSKRRATEGSRRSSQVTEISIRPPSPASIVSVGPLYNFRDEPDWDVSLRDSAVSGSRRSSWMQDVDTSNESRRGSVSSGGSRRKRKSRSADPLSPGEDENMVSRVSTPTEARTPTQSSFSTEMFGRTEPRPRRESRRPSGASSVRMRRRSSSTGHSVGLERRNSEAGSIGKRRSMDVGRISLRDAPTGVTSLNLGQGSSGDVDIWEGIDRDAILDAKPNTIKQFIRIGFHSRKHGEEFEDHLSEINQADPWAISKDKTSEKWTSGVLGSSYQIVRLSVEGNQQGRSEAHLSRSRHDPLTPTNQPRRDASKDVQLRRTDVQQGQPLLSDIRIHHHAAVDGFSITRTFKHDHVTHMERAILLATKKSLRQYTNTRTTNSLQSHGLLDDDKDRKGKDRREDSMQNMVDSSAPRTSSGQRSPQEFYSPPRPSTADSIDSTTLSSTLANVSDPSLTLTTGEVTPVSTDMLGSNVRQGNTEADVPPSTAQTSGSSIRRMFSFFKSSSPEATRPDPKKPQSVEERAAEKRRAEEFARSFQGSFVQSGLLPRMPARPRKAKNYPEPCKALRVVESDQYCMVLPLWGDGPRRRHKPHTHSRSLSPDIPVESRKFLLVYLLPIPSPPNQSSSDFTERPLPSQAYRHGFKVHGRMLHYEQLSTSGIRLPIHGLPVRTAPAELLPPPPSPLDDDTEDPIMATITKKKPSHSMVMLHFEAFVKLGLAITTDQPVFFPEKAFLTELGWAVTEMIWSGCFALLNFGS